MNTKSDTLRGKKIKIKPVFKFRFKTWEELKKYLAENARLYSK
jgi:hypothetical protein